MAVAHSRQMLGARSWMKQVHTRLNEEAHSLRRAPERRVAVGERVMLFAACPRNCLAVEEKNRCPQELVQ
jgi:hypothetical protein